MIHVCEDHRSFLCSIAVSRRGLTWITHFCLYNNGHGTISIYYVTQRHVDVETETTQRNITRDVTSSIQNNRTRGCGHLHIDLWPAQQLFHLSWTSSRHVAFTNILIQRRRLADYLWSIQLVDESIMIVWTCFKLRGLACCGESWD